MCVLVKRKVAPVTHESRPKSGNLGFRRQKRFECPMRGSSNGFSSMTEEMQICLAMASEFNRPQQRPRTRSSVSIGLQRASSLPALVPHERTLPLQPPPPRPPQPLASGLGVAAQGGTAHAASLSSLALPEIIGRRERGERGTRVQSRPDYPYFSSPTFKDRSQRPKRADRPAADSSAPLEERTSLGIGPSTSVTPASNMDDPVRVYVLRKNKKSHLIRPTRLPPLQSHSVRKA